jgi:glucose dehydrogenase
MPRATRRRGENLRHRPGEQKVIWERPAGTTRDMNIFGTHTNLPLPTGIFMMGEMSLHKVG